MEPPKGPLRVSRSIYRVSVTQEHHKKNANHLQNWPHSAQWPFLFVIHWRDSSMHSSSELVRNVSKPQVHCCFVIHVLTMLLTFPRQLWHRVGSRLHQASAPRDAQGPSWRHNWRCSSAKQSHTLLLPQRWATGSSLTPPQQCPPALFAGGKQVEAQGSLMSSSSGRG